MAEGHAIRKMSSIMGEAIREMNSVDDDYVKKADEFFEHYTLRLFMELMNLVPEELLDKNYFDALDEIFNNNGGKIADEMFQKLIEKHLKED